MEAELHEKLQAFAAKWKEYGGTEQAGAQTYLNELLYYYDVEVLPGTVFESHPIRIRQRRPTQRGLFGAEGDTVVVSTAARMDMYLPKICVWEMKGPEEKNLERHHDQLLGYWARTRTRYMVLCNFHQIWIYDTDQENGQLTPVKKLHLTELPANPEALFFLRGEESHFARRAERITQEMGARVGRVLREHLEETDKRDKDRATRFLLECVFAMFAEDSELVPKRLFTNVLEKASSAGKLDPVYELFDDFARPDGTAKKNRFAPYVNGTLFDLVNPKIKLSQAHIDTLLTAARGYDWLDVRPEIFGSIFEQALEITDRHELGAHYTHEEDVLKVVGPVVVAPWRERIRAIRTIKDAERVIAQMRAFHVLDPACGSGNFLYVAYREMKRMEAALKQKWTETSKWKAKRRSDIVPPPSGPYFTLDQIHGIELDSFAANLTRVVLWIGEYLANRELGFDEETLPLKNLNENILNTDALFLDWIRPEGELAIVGNPPYLGIRKMRAELGDDYVDRLFEAFPDNRAADLVTCWYTKALASLREGERAGYVSTNSITQNESRGASIDKVVAAGGTLVNAWKSYEWPGEAAVHVSIVNWIMSSTYDGLRVLDGREVSAITPGLTDGVDVSQAKTIPANEGLSFMGVTPGNAEFVLDDEQRKTIIEADLKSAGVIKPYLIGRDVNREIDQKPTRWIIDFGLMERDEAAKYVGAFRYVQKNVYPIPEGKQA